MSTGIVRSRSAAVLMHGPRQNTRSRKKLGLLRTALFRRCLSRRRGPFRAVGEAFLGHADVNHAVFDIDFRGAHINAGRQVTDRKTVADLKSDTCTISSAAFSSCID